MSQLLRWCYLALIFWQIIWLGFLVTPHGPQLGWWSLMISAPLLLTLRGVWNTDPKGINWASYLLLFYFMLGVSEAWSSPDQRIAALTQLALVCTCLTTIILTNLRLKRALRGQ